MNSHLDIELGLTPYQLTKNNLNEAIELIQEIQTKVESNPQAQAKLKEIKEASQSLLKHLESGPLKTFDQPNKMIQDSIRDILKQFKRLAVALLKKPNQFQMFNQDDAVLKSFNAIHSILNTWDKFLKPEETSDYKRITLSDQ